MRYEIEAGGRVRRVTVDRTGGTFNPLHSATLGEWELPTEHAVSGVRTLTIPLSSN